MENDQKNAGRSAGKIIGELSRAAHIYFHAEFKQYSIGHAQIRTLFYLAHNEGATQIELANHLHLDKSSVTSQIKILEKNGYIMRQSAEKDARMQQIRITEKTKEILEPMKKVFLSWTDILLEGFNEKEISGVFAYLDRMNANAKNKLNQIRNQD